MTTTPVSLTRAAAEQLWGPNPQSWPAWSCQQCAQRNSGWSLKCGRCDSDRAAPARPRGWTCSCGNAGATGDRSECDPLECAAWNDEPAIARQAQPDDTVERLIAAVGEQSTALEKALWHATVALQAIATGESNDVEQTAAVALERVGRQLATRR